MARPRAARNIKRHHLGEHNGAGYVLESCPMQLTTEAGQEYQGEVCLVKRTGPGLPYGVTCNGDLIIDGDREATFATIADAATFAKL